MMMPSMLLLLMFGLLDVAALQPAATGVWQAEYTTTEGRSHEFTITLEAAGGEVSGTISSPRGSVPITRGRVDGRDIALTVTRRASYDVIDVTFTGTIEGDVMRLAMRMGAREPIAVTARRAAPAPSTAER